MDNLSRLEMQKIPCEPDIMIERLNEILGWNEGNIDPDLNPYGEVELSGNRAYMRLEFASHKPFGWVLAIEEGRVVFQAMCNINSDNPTPTTTLNLGLEKHGDRYRLYQFFYHHITKNPAACNEAIMDIITNLPSYFGCPTA